ncbi:phosphodiesterase [Thalassoglobus neptunius]|uniref:Phosphodiesterase n=1 Tax=Thalassoglobus neptunius TaxID=1938619 RepID=A0A5C5X410_9PLAN|nr:metallophosphoesterase family protein [Thalassoglobus neptunius]TWT56963.1 phosphodiesterase [Thalassoglobus neptunius]
MRAIISDIHGNLEALEAVLSEIKSKGITEIYCLGDIIGYGPNPRECIDLVMENCQVTILGNHDQAALFDPDGFNAGAERAIFWTRTMLEQGDPNGNENRWEFLGELPRMKREEPFLFVHGSARNPLNEYVFPEDVYNQRKMERIFGLVDNFCFQGHTHIPGVFTEDYNFYSPDEIGHQFQLETNKVLVNVGSVGQPRDGNPKASYVVIEDRTVHFCRTGYDFEKTIAKIYPIPDLDNFLGDRLRDGR